MPGEIAIVGIGCRFPGDAISASLLWESLLNGVDAVTEVGADRWSVDQFYSPRRGAIGKSATRWAGQVSDIDRFDCEFFGISPREASLMDPQQRMLLEVCWEALEDAGQLPSHLRGRPVGVFVGGFTLDYMLMQLGSMDLRGIESHTATGSMMTLLANRISYVYGLNGPSITIDTACSSSLVAVHQACRSILSGESDMAIAGGVNALLTPSYTVAESRAGMLSPTGRCRTFDSHADGYTRGEGAGLVVLKALDRARADGDRIYAVIRATATNHVGESEGLTVPSGDAQMALMREALESACIRPNQITYAEAHGTGTPVGDPIEARAIGTVMREGRDGLPDCLVGSIKTNIGHTEAAAGVAGLIKAALVLHHRKVPPHLHLKEVNPAIDLQSLRLRVPQEVVELPQRGELFACVNSFGFGGANAHVVLSTAENARVQTEFVPEQEADGVHESSAVWVLPLSAGDEASLSGMAEDLAAMLQRPDQDVSLTDLCSSAALRRDHLPWRACAYGPDRKALIDGLKHLAGGASSEEGDATRSVKGHVSGQGGQYRVFVYTGMGPQWAGMGMSLYQSDRVFRRALDRVVDMFEQLGAPLRSWWLDDPDRSRMEETEVAQPANFAIQVALTEWLAHHGIVPDVCVGHSAGEPAAAWASGALDLADAVKVSWVRSHLQQLASGKGTMMALGLGEAEALESIRKQGDATLSLAAVNSPVSVTVAGSVEGIDAFTLAMEAEGHFARRLQVKVPYHSVYMDPLEAPLMSELADIRPRSGHLPLYSTVTGEPIDGAALDAGYWWRNVRQPVLFERAVRAIHQQFGRELDWLEVGPHPVLARSITETLEETGLVSARCHECLHRKGDGADRVRKLVAGWYVNGHPVDWKAIYGQGRFVSLPRRRWQDVRPWFEMPAVQDRRIRPPVQPLLSRRVNVMQPTWEADLLAPRLSWLEDHRIGGALVLPGAAYVSMAMFAAHELYGDSRRASVSDVRFERALYWSPDERRTVQISVDRDTHEFVIASRLADDVLSSWEQHCTGRLLLAMAPEHVVAPVAEVRHRCVAQEDGDRCYRRLRSMGLEYGEQFRGIEEVWLGEGEILAHLGLPASTQEQLADFDLHPVVLDLCLQTIAAAIPRADAGDVVYMPVGIGRVRRVGELSESLWAHATLKRGSADDLTADVALYNEQNELALLVSGCRIVALREGEQQQLKTQQLFCIDWQPVPRIAVPAQEPRAGEQWLLYGTDSVLLQAVTEQFNAAGVIVQAAGTAAELADPQGRQRVAERLAQAGNGLAGVVFLQPASCRRDSIDELSELTLAGLHLIQGMADHAAFGAVRRQLQLWTVTRSTQRVGDHPVRCPVAASLWGLGRVAGHAEQPDIWGGLIDLDDHDDPMEEGRRIVDECLGERDHDEIAWRSGIRHVARVVQDPRSLEGEIAPRFRADGTYLVTGGLGALGLATARWLAQRGAGHIVLIGRHGLPGAGVQDNPAGISPEVLHKVTAVRSMAMHGAHVRIEKLDIGSRKEVRALMTRLQEAGCPPVRGVIHSAGVTDNHLLTDVDDEQFMKVFDAKVQGAWNLHHALEGAPLDFFVAYSSATVYLASAGQGNYASANAALDGLMNWRHGAGLPAQAIGWGPWRDGGLARSLDLVPFYIRRGLHALSDEQGMAALGSLLCDPVPNGMVVGMSWHAYAKTSLGGIPAPLIREVVEEESRSAGMSDGAAEGASLGLRARMDAETDPDGKHEALTEGLRLLISEVMGLRADALGAEDAFTSRGMDSMMAIEIKARIEKQLPVRVAVVDLLRGASASSLAGILGEQLMAAPSPEPDMETLAASLQTLSDSELERLLSEVEQG